MRHPLLAQTGAESPQHLEPKQPELHGVTGYEQQFLKSIGERDGASLKPAYRHTYATAAPAPDKFHRSTSGAGGV
jgi:hypothetical protein